MSKDELTEIAMQIIVNSGSARSYAMQAIKLARNRDYAKAKELLNKSEKYYLFAHESQTHLITTEAKDKKNISLNLLMIHAQDHLSIALVTKDLAIEFIEIYTRLEEYKC